MYLKRKNLVFYCNISHHGARPGASSDNTKVIKIKLITCNLKSIKIFGVLKEQVVTNLTLATGLYGAQMVIL